MLASRGAATRRQRIILGAVSLALHLIQLYSGRALTVVGATGSIGTLTFDRGGTNLLATGNDGTVRVYSTALSGDPIETLAGHNAPVTSASFGAGDAYIASSSNDGTARLWQGIVPTPAMSRGRGEGSASTLAFSSTGNQILVTGGAPGAGTGRILSARTLAPLVRFSAPAGQVFLGARWEHEGTRVVALSGLTGPRGVTATEAESFASDTGTMVAAMHPSVGTAFFGFSVSRDGTRGVGIEADGTVSLWR